MHVLILCNGKIPPATLFEECLSRADMFIAADGGGNSARELGTLPDLVIGDLDSFRPHEDDSFEVIHDPDQESNDLEKALACARSRGATEVTVLGAVGRRLDHTLKNLSVLKQFHTKFDQLVFKTRNCDIFLLPRQFRAGAAPGTTVSLFPLSGKVTGITTSGLKYPLEGEKLENGVRDGSSNMVSESLFTIRHESGDLLIMLHRGAYANNDGNE